MKKVIEFIRTKKTIIGAILLAIVAYLKVSNTIDLNQTVLAIAVLGVLGFAAAKDSNDHSTSDQVAKADQKKEELTNGTTTPNS